MKQRYDVIVVGGGHAGAEAAWAASSAGASVALVTLDPAKIGVMSCNPAIGGLAKGQVAREVDALGGLMGRAADASGVMFKTLNTSKGPAVRGPRAQCDRHAYAESVRALIEARSEITVIAGAVEAFDVDDARRGRTIRGVRVRPRQGEALTIFTTALVLTTGTFMRGLMHTGGRRTPGGRFGEAPASAISEALRGLGFELGRLKTGTPPRLRRGSIDWDGLDPQLGDDDPAPFSDLSDRAPTFTPPLAQVECRITRTSPEAHALIRANLHRAPMYNGQLESVGPRYCPSLEDKVVRFADRETHHVFLEPESHRDDLVYCNGIATSLPTDVQDVVVRTMPGCAEAEVVRYGYAVEYDMVLPRQIDATTMTKRVGGLFLAGQINGTSGYEEAAGQGVVAGVNAARFAAGAPLVTLGRDEAYIGVMMDDLVTRTPREPYRLFTSRAEHRLLLRADNAADRLTPLAHSLGLVCAERRARFERRRAQLARAHRRLDEQRVDGVKLAELAKRPTFTTADLAQALGPEFDQGVVETAHADRLYEGYIARQRAEIKRQAAMERRSIPQALLSEAVSGLRTEAAQALDRYRPRTFGQASRLEGVTPADMALLMVAARRQGSAASPRS